MSTSAQIGNQTLLKLGDGASPEVFTTIGEVTTISEFGQSFEAIEVTHMLSTAKEFIGGIPDGAQVTVVCNLLPSNTQQAAFITAAQARTVKNWRITLPSGLGGLSYSFAALITDWKDSFALAMGGNSRATRTITLKVTGPVTGLA